MAYTLTMVPPNPKITTNHKQQVIPCQSNATEGIPWWPKFPNSSFASTNLWIQIQYGNAAITHICVSLCYVTMSKLNWLLASAVQCTINTLYHICTISVGEGAVMVEDVSSTQLDVWLDLWVARLSELCQAVLQVVQQALRHQRILVQIHQVRRLHSKQFLLRSCSHSTAVKSQSECPSTFSNFMWAVKLYSNKILRF